MTNKEKVIWKQYPDYPFVEVNQFGEIRTKDRVVIRKNGSNLPVKGHVLKQYDNGQGYMRVALRVNNKTIYLRVHRIVATCFIPNPNNLPEVNHIDCNRANNAVSNLEWCSHQENVAYRDRLGRTSRKGGMKKSVFAINLRTFKVLRFPSQHEAARQLGVDVRGVNGVLKGRQKTAGGCWLCNAGGDVIENVKSKFGDEVANKVEEIMSGELWPQIKVRNK